MEKLTNLCLVLFGLFILATTAVPPQDLKCDAATLFKTTRYTLIAIGLACILVGILNYFYFKSSPSTLYLIMLLILSTTPAILSIVNIACIQRWIVYGTCGGAALLLLLIVLQLIGKKSNKNNAQYGSYIVRRTPGRRTPLKYRGRVY
jgi:uncharacterized membrane protein